MIEKQRRTWENELEKDLALFRKRYDYDRKNKVEEIHLDTKSMTTCGDCK